MWMKVLSWMSRPVKTSESSSLPAACCLTEPSERLPMKTTSWTPNTQNFERILKCWFKPLSFGMFCYTAIGNQNPDIGYLLFGFIFNHNTPLLLYIIFIKIFVNLLISLLSLFCIYSSMLRKCVCVCVCVCVFHSIT